MSTSHNLPELHNAGVSLHRILFLHCISLLFCEYYPVPAAHMEKEHASLPQIYSNTGRLHISFCRCPILFSLSVCIIIHHVPLHHPHMCNVYHWLPRVQFRVPCSFLWAAGLQNPVPVSRDPVIRGNNFLFRIFPDSAVLTCMPLHKGLSEDISGLLRPDMRWGI